MGRLIKSEFLKLSKSLGYKVLLLCSASIGVLVGCLVTLPYIDIEMNGRIMYLQLLSETQTQAIIVSIFAAVFICHEFSDRTFNIGIMSGCSRLSLLFSKAVAYIAGLVSIILIYPIAAAVITTIAMGFGETNADVWRHMIRTTYLFVIGIIAMGGFCFTLAIFIKNIGGTIGAGIGLLLVIILAGQFPPFSPVMKFTFTYQQAQVSQPESMILYHVIICITIILSLIVSANIFKKSELK